MFKKDVENDIIYLLVEYKVPVIVEGKDVIDFRDENSFIYGFGLSNMQVLVAILLLFAMIFNKNPENISGVLR